MDTVGRFFLLRSPSILMPLRGKKRKEQIQSSLHKGSPTEFLFLCHRVAHGELSWHTALSVLDRSLIGDHSFFFSRHLVAQGEISRHTALSVLDRSFLFLTPPRGTGRNFLTHRSVGSLPIFPFFSTPPRGTRRNFPTHRSIGPRPIFPFVFFFHATSWHRAKFPDTPLHQSSTDFFFTPPRGIEQKSPTHCSIGPRPISFFVLHYIVAQSRSPRHIAQTVHTTMWPDKQNQTPLSNHNGPWPEPHVQRPSKEQEKIGANSVNNFFGPQLGKQKTKQLPDI